MTKKILTFMAGLVGLVYLLNPGAGIIELLPDNAPIIGNLDEAAATLLVVSAFRAWRKKNN